MCRTARTQLLPKAGPLLSTIPGRVVDAASPPLFVCAIPNGPYRYVHCIVYTLQL